MVRANNETLCHGDTLEKILRWVPWSRTAVVRKEMIHRLIRMKALERYRLLDRYYLIAIDGTGSVTYHQRHCDKCLTMTSKKTGKTTYYHPVLEAKLVTATGLAFSMETEFIENPEMEGKKKGKQRVKQDCELKAFYRLAKKLKENFPQLSICLVLDGLYAAKPVFDICRKNAWKFIITFKPGSMPKTYEEFLALQKLQADNRIIHRVNNIHQSFRWVTEIAYEDHLLNAFQCVENKPNARSQFFAWITNLTMTRQNVVSIANNGGRQRWKIENQGFNIQKNGGYSLEHAYSKNENAGKNYYLFLQIAHTINQLIERGSLLRNAGLRYGSIKNIARLLLESLRNSSLADPQYNALFQTPFQIRLNTG